MIRRIEQDQAPYAVLTLQDVDARIILFDLPEMAHIQAQDIADDGLVDGVMSGDEDRLAVVLPDVIIKGSAGADADIFQGFAALAGHGHRMRLCMPAVEFFRILSFDFIGQLPFPIAVVDFQEPVVLEDRQAVEIRTERAGHVRPFEGAGNGYVDGRILQAFGDHMALAEAPFAQVRVFLALVTAFNIPLCFAVANEYDAYHSFPLLVNIAVNELHVEDAIDRAELDHDVVGDVILDGNGHDVVARFGHAADLHAHDVDMSLAEDSRNLTDHVRLVDVRYQEQVAFGREVDAVFIDLDNFGFRPVEQDTDDGVFALIGADPDSDGVDEIAIGLAVDFFDGNVARLGDFGGIDVVDRFLEDRVEGPFEDGRRQQARFCIGQFARVFDFDFLHRRIGQVNGQVAHAFHEVEIRMDDIVDIGRYRSHVDGRSDGFAFQGFHDAFGDVDGNADLSFDSRSAEVRRNDDVIHAQEGVDVLGQRFRREDVDSGAGDVAALEGFSQCIDIEDRPAGYVDDPDAVFHLGDFFLADEAPRFFGQRRMHGDVVRPLEERIQVDLFDAELFEPFFRDVRVIADGLHFHSLHAFGNARTDAADADDADGLVLELDARKGLAVPVAGHERIVGLRDVAGNGHDHGAGMFRSGQGVGRRRIDDDDAPCRRTLQVDAVDADTGTADDLQFRSRFDDLFRDVGHGTGNEAVVFADAVDEALFIEVLLHIYFISIFA